jgi:hypothetical protein
MAAFVTIPLKGYHSYQKCEMGLTGLGGGVQSSSAMPKLNLLGVADHLAHFLSPERWGMGLPPDHRRVTAMVMNRIQFQPGLSRAEFQHSYGAEAHSRPRRPGARRIP